LRSETSDADDELYVVDRNQRLVGMVPARVLVRAMPDARVEDIMRPAMNQVSPRASLNAVRAHPGWADARTLPVVADDKRLLGVIGFGTARQHEGAPLTDTLVGTSPVLATRCGEDRPRQLRYPRSGASDRRTPSLLELRATPQQAGCVSAGGDLAQMTVCTKEDPEKTLMRSERARAVRGALDSLPERQRRLLERHYFAEERFDHLAVDIPMAYLFGKGPATQYPVGPQGYLNLSADSQASDIQILFGAGPMNAHPWFPFVRKPFASTFGARAVLLHPKSRGAVRLASADPRDPMKLRGGFLTEAEDMDTLRQGFRKVRDILSEPGLDAYRGKELLPGDAITGDGELDAFIRRTCITVHHPLGTCRMGTDDGAVVDGDLRVRGIEGLRVVDASVMPDMVSGNINAAVIMIAEKASDAILGRDFLPPAAAEAANDAPETPADAAGA